MYTGAPKRPSLYRSPAGAPHGDLGHLGRSGQIWGGPAYENDTPPACGLHWPCVKPLQSSPGSKGNGRKHARAPFSAVRATRKLKVDGFSSSRGALHDAHHEKAPNAKKPGGRWAAARRRAAAALGGGAPPPNGPRGRRPLGAGPAGRSAAARLVAFSMAPRSCFPHGMQTQGNPLSFRLSLSGRP